MGVLGLIATAARACDTPVYRYAMYRWEPQAYEAFYFHRGPISKADQDLHRSLEETGKDNAVANVSVTPVDLDRKNALDSLPEPVKKLWQAQKNKPLPRYLIFTPWGEELFAGQLDAAAARQLAQSPLRSEIGKLFDQGSGMVLLILAGDNARENARMETAARAVIANAAAGKLFSDAESEPAAANPASPPANSTPNSPEEAGPPDPQQTAIRIGLVKLDRSNRAEAWLLRTLTAMIPDAPKGQKEKAPHEPMLFAIYGRGRVMPPGVGKEVTAESLTELLCFLGGSCSCTIKDQNPGLDLLMQWDWESTADKFASLDPSMAQPPLYAEVAADGSGSAPAKSGGAAAGMSPSKASKASKTSEVSGEVSGTHNAATQAASKGPQESKVPSPPAPLPKRERGVDPNSGAVPAASQSSPVASDEDQHSGDVFAVRQRWQLGAALAGAAAIVLILGFMLVRIQHHGSS